MYLSNSSDKEAVKSSWGGGGGSILEFGGGGEGLLECIQWF